MVGCRGIELYDSEENNGFRGRKSCTTKMAISLIIRLLSATQKMAIFARLNGCPDLPGMFF